MGKRLSGAIGQGHQCLRSGLAQAAGRCQGTSVFRRLGVKVALDGLPSC